MNPDSLNSFEPVYSHQEHLLVSLTGTRQLLCLGTPTRPLNTPFDEAVLAAQLIYQRAKSKEVVLCLSGGLDSECMLTTFIAANVPFKVCILDFENNLNAHDTNTAKEICRRHQIIPEIKTIDIIDFYESPQFLEYAKASSCSSPQVVVHCYLANQINGVPVFGGDFFYFHNELVYFNKPPNSIQLPHYKDFAIDRFLRRRGRFGVGHFFNYTSELIHSFLQYTRAARSHTYDNSAITTRYDFKQAIYRDGGFQFAQYPERTCKQTGFEKVKDVFAEKTKDGWAYEKLYRYPLEQLYGKTEKTFLVLKKDNHLMAKLLKEMADAK